MIAAFVAAALWAIAASFVVALAPAISRTRISTVST